MRFVVGGAVDVYQDGVRIDRDKMEGVGVAAQEVAWSAATGEREQLMEVAAADEDGIAATAFEDGRDQLAVARLKRRQQAVNDLGPDEGLVSEHHQHGRAGWGKLRDRYL